MRERDGPQTGGANGAGIDFRRLLQALDSGVMVLDLELVIHFWNEWLAVLTGIPADEALGRSLDALFPEVERGTLERQMKATLALGSPMYYPALQDGVFLPISLKRIANAVFERMRQSVTLVPYDVADRRVAVVINDHTSLEEAHHHLQRKIREIDALRAGYVDIIDRHIPMLKCNPVGLVTYVSAAFVTMTRVGAEELRGNALATFLERHATGEGWEEVWANLHKGDQWQGELELVRRDGPLLCLAVQGSVSRDEGGEVAEVTIIFQDVTDRKEIERLSVIDPLTKCANRKKFNEAMRDSLALAERYQVDFILVLLDIDHFKRVNDTFGHQAGDRVLVEVSSLVKVHLRASDLVARWGGEEFALLLPHTTLEDAQKLAEKLRKLLANNQFADVGRVTCSFGVTAFRPQDTQQSMVERADKALYRAKEGGRNQVRIA